MAIISKPPTICLTPWQAYVKKYIASLRHWKSPWSYTYIGGLHRDPFYSQYSLIVLHRKYGNAINLKRDRLIIIDYSKKKQPVSFYYDFTWWLLSKYTWVDICKYIYWHIPTHMYFGSITFRCHVYVYICMSVFAYVH